MIHRRILILLAAAAILQGPARAITISDNTVTFPSATSFRVAARAAGDSQAPVVTYLLLSAERWDSVRAIPPGFKLGVTGYLVPAKDDIPEFGDRDNGRFDGDTRPGWYARTFSTKGWPPGDYYLSLLVTNRPGPGTYAEDRRDVILRVGRAGKVRPIDLRALANVRKQDVVVFRQPGIYGAWPDLMPAGRDTLVATFTAKVSRIHAVEDATVAGSGPMVSYDGGQSWGDYDRGSIVRDCWRTRSGRLVRVRTERRQYADASRRDSLLKAGRLTLPVSVSTITIEPRQAYAQFSADSGRTWQRREVPVPDEVGSVLLWTENASQVVTSQDVVVRLAYGTRKGSPANEAFCIRSADEGETWQMAPLCPDSPPGGDNEEPALIEAQDGTLLAMIRNELDGHLYRSRSTDQGLSWSAPEKTDIVGCPAQLLKLPGNRILCSYGYRRHPMGIRACLSHDDGRTWDIKHEFILRADGANSPSDLGYPSTALLPNGWLFTIYYITLGDNVTHIAGTRWKLLK